VIVLDASVLIASLIPEDAHHAAAEAFLDAAGVEDLLVNTVTLAEVLVSPTREGRVEAVLARLGDLGVVEVPLPPGAARGLAMLRVTPGLKMPDCCVLLTAMDRRASLASFDDQLRRDAGIHGVQLALG